MEYLMPHHLLKEASWNDHMGVKDEMEKFRVCIIFFVLAGEASADIWAPPGIRDYYNADSTFCLRIYPRHVPEKYFDWLGASPRKKKRFLPADTLVIPCYAQLYKSTINGDSLSGSSN